jgi:hypothetical protein
MLAAALVAFAGCAEKSTESEAAVSGPESGSEEEFSGETMVNESCEDDYTKFTICPADEIEPKLDSKGEPSPG